MKHILNYINYLNELFSLNNSDQMYMNEHTACMDQLLVVLLLHFPLVVENSASCYIKLSAQRPVCFVPLPVSGNGKDCFVLPCFFLLLFSCLFAWCFVVVLIFILSLSVNIHEINSSRFITSSK